MKYRTIVVDPPWPLDWNARVGVGRSGQKGLPYPTMTVEAIRALPIADLAHEQAHVYVWTTHTFLYQTPALLASWGFQHRYTLVWAKAGLGMGGRFRHNTEYVLFGECGGPTPILRADLGTWFSWPRGEHSKKPEAFLDMVESVSLAPRLELFARRNRLGWDTWGNESLEHVEVMPL